MDAASEDKCKDQGDYDTETDSDDDLLEIDETEVDQDGHFIVNIIYDDTNVDNANIQDTVEITPIVKAMHDVRPHTSTIETAVKRTNPFSVLRGRPSSSLCREENGPPLKQKKAQNETTKPPCLEENKSTIEQRTAQSKPTTSQQCGKSGEPICGRCLKIGHLKAQCCEPQCLDNNGTPICGKCFKVKDKRINMYCCKQCTQHHHRMLRWNKNNTNKKIGKNTLCWDKK